MASRKNVLFTLRHYNDIDHIAPILHKMECANDARSYAYAYDPTLEIENDFRLDFLRSEHRTEIRSIYRAYEPNLRYKILGRLLRRNNLSKKYMQPFRKRLYSLLGTKYYNERWCRALLEEKDIGVVVTDWQQPKRYVTLQLFAAARQLGLPVVSVPHGIRLWLDSNENDWERYVFTSRFFDLNIVTHEELRARMVETGIDTRQVTNLGSARFCDEWDEIYERIYPNTLNGTTKNGSLKVVFMDHSAAAGIQKEDVIRAISKLSQIDNVKLVIKPSTRGGTNVSEVQGKNIIFDEETPSRALIKWSDVVICTVSSIILDAMRMQKVFLYPSYFIDREMLWERFSACWTVKNDDEFLTAINSLKQNKQRIPYRHSDVDRFLTHVVNGGVDKRDVLGEYVDRILEIRDRYIQYSGY